MRKRFAVLVPVLIAVLVSLLAGSASAGGSGFVSRANGERAAAGRPAYAVRADLTEVATRHARRMAARHEIFHNPNLAADVSGWSVVGENVGFGDTEQVIHEALMRSPLHRANLLSGEYTEIGVGVVTGDDGKLYVVQVFRRPEAAAAAPRVTRRAPKPAIAVAPRRPAPKPAPTLAEVLATRPAPPAGALPKALAYTELLTALASGA